MPMVATQWLRPYCAFLHERCPVFAYHSLIGVRELRPYKKVSRVGGHVPYVTKSAPQESLFEAITKALAGKQYVPKYLYFRGTATWKCSSSN